MFNPAENFATPAVVDFNKNLFISTGVLGEGGFGKVLSTMFVANGRWYATKEIRKTEAIRHPAGTAMIFDELAALKRLDHPFLINLHIAFQSR